MRLFSFVLWEKIIKKGCMMFAQNLFYKKNFFWFKKKKERNKGMKGTEAWEQTGKPRREEAWWWVFLCFFKAWVPA